MNSLDSSWVADSRITATNLTSRSVRVCNARCTNVLTNTFQAFEFTFGLALRGGLGLSYRALSRVGLRPERKTWQVNATPFFLMDSYGALTLTNPLSAQLHKPFPWQI